ncbi:hypothetical protein GGI23_005677 [Coemansia sp. RSA 2559]|nr:hypothetical protein GGI23_005677 [Coemansia sp. RSA 2559]
MTNCVHIVTIDLEPIVSQLTLLGFRPQTYRLLGNGRIEGFLESTDLTKDSMRNASTSVYIAQRMSEIHTLVSHYRPHGSGNPNSKEALYLSGHSEVWAKVDAWMEIVPNKWPGIQRRCDGHAQWAKFLDNCPRAVQAIYRLKAYI